MKLKISVIDNFPLLQTLRDNIMYSVMTQTLPSSLHLLKGYRIVSFFKVLKFCEWPILSFFTILFSQMGLPEA